jgi:hypothetical protein
MNLIDYYHRGFKSYRNETLNSKACAKDRRTLRKLGLEFDKFTVKKYLCTINEDWIIEIEKGLEFVEKAVAEERQFIRVNGEVVPIEKAKKVSKYSVEHLAKHSEMITHVPEKEGDPVIPDAIYMVEKLSDYAVYENRFLYMLLCYLRDFIALRLEKIQKLRLTYICDFGFKKSNESKLRNFDFETNFHEERYDNPYPIFDELSSSLLKRIEDCQQIIVVLLNTNLMIEVSKTPMVRPPIVKTNVLKMNNNFKNALALYNYVVEYDGDGFTSEEVIKDFVPLSDLMADELVELEILTQFLTYKFGNEITDVLENAFQEEEERRRRLENERFLEQIKRLKKRVAESGMGLEEYMLALEKRNKMLEQDSQDLLIARNEILNLNKKIEELNSEIIELNRKIDDLNNIIEEKIKEIAYLNQKYIDDMNALKKAHAEEIAELNYNHKLEIDDLNDKYAEEIRVLNENHEIEINLLKEDHENQIKELEEKQRLEIIDMRESIYKEFESRLNEYSNEISRLNGIIKDKNSEKEALILDYDTRINSYEEKIKEMALKKEELIDTYEKELKQLEKKYLDEIASSQKDFNEKLREMRVAKQATDDTSALINAENRALRVKLGMDKVSLDFTSKERFDELEDEFMVFNKFFKEQWQMTKKEIRKELLWVKKEKKEKTDEEA